MCYSCLWCEPLTGRHQAEHVRFTRPWNYLNAVNVNTRTHVLTAITSFLSCKRTPCYEGYSSSFTLNLYFLVLKLWNSPHLFSPWGREYFCNFFGGTSALVGTKMSHKTLDRCEIPPNSSLLVGRVKPFILDAVKDKSVLAVLVHSMRFCTYQLNHDSHTAALNGCTQSLLLDSQWSFYPSLNVL